MDTPGGWKVEDATGFAVAYIYADDRPKGASDDSMTKEQARKIAVNIARLPELLKR